MEIGQAVCMWRRNRKSVPTSDRSRRRAALRAEWFACANAPLDTHDMLAD
jgi:hypothetical protein